MRTPARSSYAAPRTSSYAAADTARR